MKVTTGPACTALRRTGQNQTGSSAEPWRAFTRTHHFAPARRRSRSARPNVAQIAYRTRQTVEFSHQQRFDLPGTRQRQKPRHTGRSSVFADSCSVMYSLTSVSRIVAVASTLARCASELIVCHRQCSCGHRSADQRFRWQVQADDSSERKRCTTCYSEVRGLGRQHRLSSEVLRFKLVRYHAV